MSNSPTATTNDAVFLAEKLSGHSGSRSPLPCNAGTMALSIRGQTGPCPSQLCHHSKVSWGPLELQTCQEHRGRGEAVGTCLNLSEYIRPQHTCIYTHSCLLKQNSAGNSLSRLEMCVTVHKQEQSKANNGALKEQANKKTLLKLYEFNWSVNKNDLHVLSKEREH